MEHSNFIRCRALWFDKPGNPAEVLKINEIEVPKQVGPTEVLLKMKAAAVHPSDFLYVQGQYLQPTKPGRAGAEGVGVIESVGSSVTHLKVGQRMAFWTESFQTGTWGEYFVMDTKICRLYITIPDNISDEAAAQLILNPLTLLGMLSDLQDYGMKRGDWFLQTAAGGSLGRMMIQVAKIKGFKTLNVVRRESQISELKSLGGDAVILQDKLTQSAKEVTKGELKYAIDPIGGTVVDDILNSFSNNGVLLLYGLLSGSDVKFSLASVIGHELGVRGFYVSLFAKNKPDKTKELLHEIIELMRSGTWKVPAKTFKFELFKAAIEHTTAPGKAEKTILVF